MKMSFTYLLASNFSIAALILVSLAVNYMVATMVVRALSTPKTESIF